MLDVPVLPSHCALGSEQYEKGYKAWSRLNTFTLSKSCLYEWNEILKKKDNWRVIEQVTESFSASEMLLLSLTLIFYLCQISKVSPYYQMLEIPLQGRGLSLFGFYPVSHPDICWVWTQQDFHFSVYVCVCTTSQCVLQPGKATSLGLVLLENHILLFS